MGASFNTGRIKEMAGAGKYAKEITLALSKLDARNEYYLYGSQEIKNEFKNVGNNFHFITTNFNPNHHISRILWEQFVFPFKLKKLNPNIIFTPSVAIPFLFNGIFFTTIHDLAYKKNKYKYSFIRKIYIEIISKIAIKKSLVIFTVSNFSKKEIEDEFSLKSKKIFITYNGVNEIFFKDYASEEIRNFKIKYNLPENFILYVGAIEPGKNLDKLFIAFSELIKKYELELNLVLTSGIGWGTQKLINLIEKLKIRDKVIFLPYISEDDLPMLYKCSRMLTYLSEYEGFGIPVLEALAVGTPVITSKSAAIMEFSNETAVSVNPRQIHEIVNSMYKIINDKDFVNSKVVKGKEQAEKFKWLNSPYFSLPSQ